MKRPGTFGGYVIRRGPRPRGVADYHQRSASSVASRAADVEVGAPPSVACAASFRRKRGALSDMRSLGEGRPVAHRRDLMRLHAVLASAAMPAEGGLGGQVPCTARSLLA